MKCYTWELGEVTSGIQVEEDENLGIVIPLGSEGRGGGRYLEKVELFQKDPPEIKEGRIFDAHPVKIVTELEKHKHYHKLAKPPDSSNNGRILVRINTRWVFTRGTHGKWESLAGSPKDLMVGYGSRDIVTQRSATWSDGLILLSPGDAVCITPEGGYKVELYVVFYDKDGVVHDLLLSEYRSRFASVVKEIFI